MPLNQNLSILFRNALFVMAGELYRSKELSVTPVKAKATLLFQPRKIERKTMEKNSNLDKAEVIRRIEQVYHAGYDPDSDLSAWDQLEICESIAETETEYQGRYERTNESVRVNRSVNDTNKRRINFELTESKLKAITRLKSCNYRTPPIEVAALLEEFFADPNTKQGHWLYVAQNYTPRTINRVINHMIKVHISGEKTIQKPAGYFTHLIKFRKKRRSL